MLKKLVIYFRYKKEWRYTDPFLIITTSPVKKDDILYNGYGEVRVLKVYPNWWRKLLRKLGSKIPINSAKVQHIVQS